MIMVIVISGALIIHVKARPRGYKTFSMLNSAELEIYLAHKLLAF